MFVLGSQSPDTVENTGAALHPALFSWLQLVLLHKQAATQEHTAISPIPTDRVPLSLQPLQSFEFSLT